MKKEEVSQVMEENIVKYIKLKHIAKITMGQSPDSKSYNNEKKGLPFYQGKSDFGKINPIPRVWCSNPIKVAEKDDIIISVRAPIGNTNIMTEKSCIGRGLAAITPLDDKVNIKYLYYVINSKYEELNKYGVGSTFKAITKDVLYNLEIKEIPDIKIQSDVVKKLDIIDEIIDIRKNQIKYLNNFVKAHFVKLFGNVELNDKNFKEEEISNIAEISSSKRIYANEYKEKGVPFYRSKEIIELGHNKKPSIKLFISTKRYEEIKEKYGIPNKGDILITAVGTIGETWIVNTNEPFYFKDGNILLIRLNTNISQIYFKNVLDILINIFKSKNISGSAYSALTIEKFKKMKIILPPIELQNQFAKFIEKIDKQKCEIYKNLKQMELLQESLINKFFG